MDRARRRKFGQNFLNDATAALIASDLLVSTESILEIGPGHGALTQHLLKKNTPLLAVEIDELCVSVLREKFAEFQNFSVVNQNFLDFDLRKFLDVNPKAWITGNLPYNVSTAIVADLMPFLKYSSGFMGMVQLEVAERLCAKPASKAYGSLSVWVQAHAQAQIVRRVGPENFSPKPNVDSATIMLRPLECPLQAPIAFFEWVQIAFSMKRKRIANSLSKHFEKALVFEALASLGLSENTRAEELSPQKLLDLYQALQSKI